MSVEVRIGGGAVEGFVLRKGSAQTLDKAEPSVLIRLDFFKHRRDTSKRIF